MNLKENETSTSKLRKTTGLFSTLQGSVTSLPRVTLTDAGTTVNLWTWARAAAASSARRRAVRGSMAQGSMAQGSRARA